MVNYTVYYLFILTWGLSIFEKEETSEKRCVEIEHWGTSVPLYQGLKKITCKASLLFYCFLPIKIILKVLFSFIPWLLNFFDLPSYGSNSRKRYTLRLFSMCLGKSTPVSAKKLPFDSLFDTLRWPPFSLALH